jgi:hypothetical protein
LDGWEFRIAASTPLGVPAPQISYARLGRDRRSSGDSGSHSKRCKAQKKSVIGAHNRCWKYLVGAITTHGEAKRDLEFIGGDKDRQLKKLWTETRIGSSLPWDDIEDEAERLLESNGVTGHTSENTHADQDLGDSQGVELDETDPSHEVIFGRRRPYSIAVDWNNKVLHILEFKRISDQRHTYRQRGENLEHGLNTTSL